MDYRLVALRGVTRVVPYGSFAWKLLMLNCEHLVSSHADAMIFRRWPAWSASGRGGTHSSTTA